jgi:hypothetical protein
VEWLQTYIAYLLDFVYREIPWLLAMALRRDRIITTYAVVGRKIGCSDYDEVSADFLTWPQPQPVSESSILDGTRYLWSIQTAIASICTN